MDGGDDLEVDGGLLVEEGICGHAQEDFHPLSFQQLFSFVSKTVFLPRMFRIFRINGLYQILSCGRIQVKFQEIAFILQSYYTHNLFGRKRLFPDCGQHFFHLWGSCGVTAGSYPTVVRV